MFDTILVEEIIIQPFFADSNFKTTIETLENKNFFMRFSIIQ
jgi:hypothetical protein